MAIRLWPQDYERKDHITKAEKGILRYAARNFQNGHMVVGIDPVGLSGEKVKLGMYISPNEGLVTFSIYSGMINEIYRYLPSVVVSTIDKMAMLGTSNDFKMLFGQVKKKCPVHGFTGNTKCSCASCGGHVLQNVGLLKDPIPTLFIQDEMHLVKESLGTFDAHYESFLSYYAKELVPEAQRKLIRFVGATATIS